jgi:nitroreductase
VNDFMELARSQRACRAFTREPVDDEIVERVLEAATHAPSAENAQPWVFVVVRDPAVRERIGALIARMWSASGRERSRARLAPAVFADVDRGATGGISGAPVLIVVAGDTERSAPASLPASVFPAVQNLLLAAGAAGLGSALTTLPTFDDELRALVGLPASIRPLAVVPIGYPTRRLGPPRRVPVAEKAHRDRYGKPW